MFRKKRGVSPVIAVVLILGLTLAATAIVFLVVLPMVNQRNAPELYIDETSAPLFMDYDNDGKCDYITVQVGNIGGSMFNVTNITIAASKDSSSNFYTWVLMDNVNGTIDVNERVLLRMRAAVDDVDEIDDGSSLILTLINDQYIVGLEIGTITVEQGEPLSIEFTDSSGDPVVGSNIYFYYSTGEFAYTGEPTSVSGVSNTYLFPGTYYAKAQSGLQFYTTDVFIHPGTPQLHLEISGGTLTVKVKSGTTPLSGVRTYLYDTYGHYLNEYSDTNSDGLATYSLDDGLYKIRADVSGIIYYSENINFPNTTYVEIDTGGGTVYAHVIDGGNNPISNTRVYLFRESGSYTGKYANTNSTGYAEFSAVPGGTNYKFRVDYLAYRIWSQTFGASDGAVIDVNVGGGTIYVNVTDADGNPIRNTRTYLFTSSGSYTGKYANTNTSGIATYGSVAAGDYKIRIDYLAQRFWSPVFTASNGLIVNASIGGGTLYGNITVAGNALVNARVYLFTASGSYTGKYGNTNSEGIVTFTGIGTSNYKLRVDYQADRHWSDAFYFNETMVYHFELGGGTIYANVTAGGVPVANTRVYVFTASGSYTGTYNNTNSSGIATFTTLSSGNYKFRVDYLAKRFWSDVFTASDGLVVDVDLGGGTIYVHLNNTYGVDIANVRLYLFTSSGSYTGKYTNTNATGWGVFEGIGESDYKVRADYLAKRYWSNVFTATDGKIVDFNIGGGIVWLHVFDGSGTDISGPRAYLFTSSGSYTGIYRNLNGTGYLNFTGIGDGDFKWRVDYLAKRFWSDVFSATNGYIEEFNIGGGTIYVHLTVNGADVNNGRIYLYTNTGSYTGKSVVTNSSGWAVFYGIGAGDYKLRYDYDGTRYWENFTAKADWEVEFAIVTTMTFSVLTVQPSKSKENY
ncbi:MAG: type IV pilin [Candidatus Heimdallarchaeum endolithica]|uniref:Type IV pilin n=1 Tax=Candidatus Heimdallarchaeum endolithica TaxID=2876572 RepID=A0A9Y1BRG8_9ARCH|nr:MAG: type IV pilin [Candidatus Heimdallarchaeum endolithica]